MHYMYKLCHNDKCKINPCTHVAEAKYLGITLGSKLTFNKHIDVISKMGGSVLSQKNYATVNQQSNPKCIRCSYMYVRLILEYYTYQM